MQEIQPQLLEQYIKILQQENLEYNRNELVRFIYEMTQLNDADVMKLLDTLKCMHENSIQHRDYVIAQDRKILKENPFAGAQSGSNHYLTRFVEGNHTYVPCKFPPVIRLPEMIDTRKHYVNSNGQWFNPIGYLDSFAKYYNSVLVIVLLYLEKLIEKLNEMKKQKQGENGKFEEFKTRIGGKRKQKRSNKKQIKNKRQKKNKTRRRSKN